MDKYVTKRSFLQGYYEAQLLSLTGKPRKVFCYISPKVIQSKLIFKFSFFTLLFSSNFKLENTSLVLFPRDHIHVKCVRLLGYVCICTMEYLTFSLSQLIFDEEPGKFTLDDGYQQSLSFYSSQREVLAATYYRFLLKNIGKQSK